MRWPTNWRTGLTAVAALIIAVLALLGLQLPVFNTSSSAPASISASATPETTTGTPAATPSTKPAAPESNCSAFLSTDDGFSYEGIGVTDNNGVISGEFDGVKNDDTPAAQYRDVTMTFTIPRIPGENVLGLVDGTRTVLNTVYTDDCSLAKGVTLPKAISQGCLISFDTIGAAWEQNSMVVYRSPLTAGQKISGTFSGIATGDPFNVHFSFTLPKNSINGTTYAMEDGHKVLLSGVSYWCDPQYAPLTGQFLVLFDLDGHVWQTSQYVTSISGGTMATFGALDEPWSITIRLPYDMYLGENGWHDHARVLSSTGAGLKPGTLIHMSALTVVNLQG